MKKKHQLNMDIVMKHVDPLDKPGSLRSEHCLNMDKWEVLNLDEQEVPHLDWYTLPLYKSFMELTIMYIVFSYMSC